MRRFSHSAFLAGNKVTPFAFFCLVGLVLFSCKQDLQLQNFDKLIWLEDHRGCEGRRDQFRESLIAQKSMLKGRSEPELLYLLGKPDKTELGSRNKKEFVYYLAPGRQCEGSDAKLYGNYLRITFNAVRLSSEVVVVY